MKLLLLTFLVSMIMAQEKTKIPLEFYFQNSLYPNDIEVYLDNSENENKLLGLIKFNDNSYHALESFSLDIIK